VKIARYRSRGSSRCTLDTEFSTWVEFLPDIVPDGYKERKA